MALGYYGLSGVIQASWEVLLLGTAQYIIAKLLPDPLMELKNHAKLLHVKVFGLTVLALHLVSLKACKNEASE